MRIVTAVISVYLPLVVSANALKPGTNLVKINHDGHLREMLVRLPENYTPMRSYPVIFGFHGAGGPKEGYHRQLEHLVHGHGFISVSPQGISNARGITGWNGFAGHRISNTDDVGFVRKSINYLKQQASIDQNRIYATGGSSGAIFCFRLAMETDLFAAIAPMRGAMIKRPPAPKNRPRISILLVCGSNDPLFKGGEQARGEVFYSAQQTMQVWATNHGHEHSPRNLEAEEGIKITHFGSRKADHELLLYAVEDTGHRLSRGQMRRALDFMGKFFLRHSKPVTSKK
jgi:polyhydroxybutyrate depolymerase